MTLTDPASLTLQLIVSTPQRRSIPAQRAYKRSAGHPEHSPTLPNPSQLEMYSKITSFALLATFTALVSGSSLIPKQTTCLATGTNGCTDPDGCFGTCSAASAGGGPAVCNNLCGNEGVYLFCAACYAGSDEADGAACSVDVDGTCTVVSS